MNRGVIVDPEERGCLSIEDVRDPAPRPNEAVVRVRAISLNPGEVRRAQNIAPGTRIGYDLAGIVEEPAADGSGPARGTPVAGLVGARNSWAERVAVPTHALAPLPPGVSMTDAATLPCAGLTALHALRKGGAILGERVLITGASGGVGHLAVQLARHAGASVVALLRREAYVSLLEQVGAHTVIVDETGAAAEKAGPYRLALDSVGGPVLAAALAALASGGTCVHFGAAAGRGVTLDSGSFFRNGPRTLYGLQLFAELRSQPAREGLSILMGLVEAGHLKPHIALQESWTRIGEIAEQLLARGYAGKAVLTVGE